MKLDGNLHSNLDQKYGHVIARFWRQAYRRSAAKCSNVLFNFQAASGPSNAI